MRFLLLPIPIGLAYWLGWALSRFIFGKEPRETLDPVRMTALPLGMAVTPLVIFLSFYLAGRPSFWPPLIIILVSLSFLLFWNKKRSFVESSRSSEQTVLPRLRFWHKLLLGLSAGLVFLRFLSGFSSMPLGFWDAWTHWNQRALFLLRAETDWTRITSFELFTDYPLLLPVWVYWVWSWVGKSVLAGPLIVGLAFFAAVLSCVWTWLRARSSATSATLCLALALGIPTLLKMTYYQIADLPFQCFVTASLLLWLEGLRARRPAYFFSCGLFSGAALFTKNEGLLFLCVLSFVFILWAFRHRKTRPFSLAKFFCAGLLIPLSVYLLFKFSLPAPPMYFFRNRPLQNYWEVLGDRSRVEVMLNYIVHHEILNPRNWGVSFLVLFAFFAFVGRGLFDEERGWVLSLIGLVFLGYFLAILISPAPFASPLYAAWDRLYYHFFLVIWVLFWEAFSKRYDPVSAETLLIRAEKR